MIGSLGEHAGTVVQLIWQADLYRSARIVIACLHVFHGADPERVRHLLCSRVAGNAIKSFLSSKGRWQFEIERGDRLEDLLHNTKKVGGILRAVQQVGVCAGSLLSKCTWGSSA